VEVEIIGRISDQLKEKMFATKRIRETWDMVEAIVLKHVSEKEIARKEQAEWLTQFSSENSLSRKDLDISKEALLQTIQLTIHMFEREIEEMIGGGMRGAYDNVAVPKAEVLDRVLRADAAAERSLQGAIDRLERLQRRRKGELVPAPVRISLTR
jgi:hypothetical protein